MNSPPPLLATPARAPQGPIAWLTRAWSVCLCVLALFATPLTAAVNDAIEVTSARLEASADGEAWVLAADFNVPLPARLEETVNGGVALYYVAEFEAYRPRWYWWDERLTQRGQTYRLSYHALTRQYRVTLNGYQQQFTNLGDAVRAMSLVRGWKVLEFDRLKPGATYDVYVRMRLDVTQLPKPFQLTAITNRDWNQQAEWKHFTFSPETTKSAQ